MTSSLLVHGICHGAWCWEATFEGLTARGHEVTAVELPLTSLADDAAIVREALDGLDDPAVLVGHSYG
ncbi:MAG: alpha/beta fold hydrolase, partial [Ilumatobacteraceae bacterium]